ncbi:MAG: T9SS type A sorting domain-containing protein [Bacteroidales bacterium]|nr:T9SS type A sorting domain-containing protein [Bacteroidales bacterium]
MAKQISIFFLILFFSKASFADILLHESFSSSLPTGFTNSIIQGSQGWSFSNSPAFASPSGGYYAVFDDNALGSAITPNEAALSTFSFSCVGRTNVKINYHHYWLGVEGTHGLVEISTNGGTIWTTVMDYHKLSRGSLASPQDTAIDVSALAAGQPDVRVRFRYTDGGFSGKYWYIDDVTIYANPDVGISELINPSYLNCGEMYNNAQLITVRISNFSHEPVTTIPVTVEITGGITLTFSETYVGTIPAESYVDYTFSTTIDMTADTFYHFNAYTSFAGDSYLSNNAWITGRQQLVQHYPYLADFNSGTFGWLNTGDAFTSPDLNRGREFAFGNLPYLNGPEGEGNSWYIDVTRHGEYYQIWVESPVFDFSENTAPVLSMDIKYQFSSYYTQAQVQYTTNGGTNWYQLGTNANPDWYLGNTNWWYNNLASPVNSWTHVERDLCLLSGNSCVKFRILAYSYYGISGATDYRHYNYFAFDNFKISEGSSDDIEPISLNLPKAGTCGNFSASELVQVLINNNTCRPLINVPVSLQIDGGIAINEIMPGPIPRFGSYLYTFTSTADLSSPGNHSIVVTTNHPSDGDVSNDVLSEIRINSNPIIAFPYIQNFDSVNNGWVSNTPQAGRHFRLDALSYLNGADGNNLSWFVEITEHGKYDLFSLESPVFDFSGLTNPMFYMDIKYQLSTYYSQFHVEFSTNGGTTWAQLGTDADPNWYEGNTNWWYNNLSNPQDEWITVVHDLCNLSGLACVKLRISGYAYYGHTGYNTQLNENTDYRHYNYFALDNVKVTNDVDVAITEIVDPDETVSGCLYSSAQQVTVRVHNYSCSTITNVPAQCDISGTAIANFSGLVPSIPAHSSVLYTFAGSFDMTPLGTYNIEAYTQLPGDYDVSNDTSSVTIDVNFPKITTYPYLETFNSGTAYWTASGESPISPDVDRGREFVLGSLPYLNGSDGNLDSWYIDVSRHGEYYKIWAESPVFDFTNNTNPVLSMDIKYQLSSYYTQVHVEYSTDGGTAWTQLGTNADPLWYVGNTNWWYNNLAVPVNSWTNVQHDLCNLSGESCVKFRILAYAYYGISGATDYRHYNYFAFDNFQISGGESDDAEPIAFTLPKAGVCGNYSASEQVQILVNNNKCRPLYNIPVSLQVDGGSVINEIMPGPIPRFGSYIYTFTTTANLSAPGNHTLFAQVNLASDGDNSNNTLTETRINNSPINSFPYIQNFNSGNEGWVSNTPQAGRHFRLDTLPYLNGSQGEGASWFVEVSEHGKYDVFTLESPVFNLSTTANPMLYMDIKYQLSSYYTQFHVEYSINGGSTWTQLGTNADPYWYVGNTNYWYNNLASPVEEWTQVQHDLCNLAGQTCVKFRIMGYAYYGISGNNDYRNYNYFAMDNFRISDSQDVGVTEIREPNIADLGCLYSTNQQIVLRVYNWSCTNAINVPVTCLVSGPVSTSLSGLVPSVPAHSYTDYTLPGSFDMTGLGTYNFTAYSTMPGDINSLNDSAFLSINVNYPTIASFPYFEDFNANNGYWVSSGDAPVLPDVDRGRDFVWGSLPYLNGPEGEGNSWYVDVSRHAEYYKFWIESPVFDFSSLVAPSLFMDIKYQFTSYYSQIHVEYSTNGGTTWTQLGTNADPSWYEGNTNWWYNNLSNPVDYWKHVEHDLCNLAGLPCVKIRILGYAYYGISGVTDYRNYNYFAIDNFEIVDNVDDVAVTAFIEPLQSQEFCTFSNAQEITVTVKNPFCNNLVNVPIVCEITGAITQTINGLVSINARSTINYTFPASVDLTALGVYNFTVYSDLSNDYNRINDTIRQTINVNYPLISTFPYYENFNSGTSYWVATGENPPLNNGRQFILGQLPYLNGSENMDDCYYVDVTTHGRYDLIWVESPVFDFTGLTNPMLSFHIKYQLSNYYTQFHVEYSTNGGVSWTQLGTNADLDWYSGNTNYWYNNYPNSVNEWTYVEHNLCNLIGQTCVKFRISGYAYYGISGATDYRNRNFFAFDNISITDAPIDAQAIFISGCYASEYSLDVQITNRNNSCNVPPAITELDITYSIDGGAPVTSSITGLNILPGATDLVVVPNVLIPDNSTDVQIWCSLPNSGIDQIVNNDSAWNSSIIWSNCNDHCSNAIELTWGTISASQTSFATPDGSEDPDFSSCGSITVENSVWYYFTTTDAGGDVTLDFTGTNCSPSANGIQVSIDQITGTPCDPANYTNVFCQASGNENDIVWNGSSLPPNTTYYVVIDGYANNDCDFFLGISGAISLPIELLKFNAELQNDAVNLHWITATEINNDYFNVEKSIDGIDFESFAQVDGAGNSNEEKNYSATDKNPATGISYYRLKQTDYDGSFSYSNIVAVNNIPFNQEFKLFPNPANEFFIVEGNNITAQKFDVLLTDILSRKVISETIISDDNTISINYLTDQLNDGVYNVQITDNQSGKIIFVEKLIIQKR